jgi:hypothetical protein
MATIKEFSRPICRDCTDSHISLKRPPICCSVGSLNFKSIEGGCDDWEAEKGGCKIYPRRDKMCRAFPNLKSYWGLLDALTKYPGCSLLDFIDALWNRTLEPRAVAAHLNNTPLFDQEELSLVANLNWWENDPPQKAQELLEKAKIKYEQIKPPEPVIILFFINPLEATYGGVFTSAPLPLTESFQEEYRKDAHLLVAGLVYPSIEKYQMAVSQKSL